MYRMVNIQQESKALCKYFYCVEDKGSYNNNIDGKI